MSNLELDLSQGTLTEFQKTQLKTYFQDRVIIIDEVHNIRDEADGKDKHEIIEIDCSLFPKCSVDLIIRHAYV